MSGNNRGDKGKITQGFFSSTLYKMEMRETWLPLKEIFLSKSSIQLPSKPPEAQEPIFAHKKRFTSTTKWTCWFQKYHNSF